MSSFDRKHTLAFLLLTAMATFVPRAGAQAPPEPGRPQTGQNVESETTPLPVFEFHSGFWVNLHHFLYQTAREQKNSAGAPKSGSAAATASAVKLTEEEERAWKAAVDFYAANYAGQDLLFNGDLIALKNELGDVETCTELSGRSSARCNAGLPPELTRVLEQAAAVYQAHWWPEHDRANRQWTAQVAPLVRQLGKQLAEELARLYQAKWPAEKVRVDVSTSANWAGAYTTLEPLRVTIASLDPRNQGTAAFEVLFHEASHGLAQPVQDAIMRECRQRGKPIPRDLWHAVLFYTTGEAVKNVMKQRVADGDGLAGAGYTPYAVREGLYTRGWTNYLRVIEKFWKPYLDGQADFSDAIARMVSAL
jgi:hypothetical protein